MREIQLFVLMFSQCGERFFGDVLQSLVIKQQLFQLVFMFTPISGR